MDTEDKVIVLIVITLSLMLYLCIIGGINLRNEYDKLKKENIKLKENISQSKIRISELEQLSESYKWQLEQVPYIIEYGCKGE